MNYFVEIFIEALVVGIVILGVGSLVSVSYTHLTLPTKA